MKILKLYPKMEDAVRAFQAEKTKNALVKMPEMSLTYPDGTYIRYRGISNLEKFIRGSRWDRISIESGAGIILNEEEMKWINQATLR